MKRTQTKSKSKISRSSDSKVKDLPVRKLSIRQEEAVKGGFGPRKDEFP